MVARAEAAAATGERILDAATELFFEDPTHDATLDEVAARAGVSVQTVIRRFGGRDGLFAAAALRAREEVDAQRSTAPVGDVAGTVRVLLDHYEAHGETALRMLADEQRNPRLAALVEDGRAMHAEWCERVFAPALEGLPAAARRRRLAQLIAICDVYTWKILRRDRGLSRAETQRALCELLEPLTNKET